MRRFIYLFCYGIWAVFAVIDRHNEHLLAFDLIMANIWIVAWFIVGEIHELKR